MANFPGLEKEVEKTAQNIKKLYKDAEEQMEGKVWAKLIKEALDTASPGMAFRFGLHLFNPEYNLISEKRTFEDFLNFIEVKFGPKLVYVDSPGLTPFDSYPYFWVIKGMGYVFKLKNEKELILYKPDPIVIKNLKQPEKGK